MAEIEMEGMNELLANLARIGRGAGRAENEAIRAGGEAFAEGASSRAPRSSASKSHMADNVVVSEIRKKNGVKFVLVGPGKTFFYGRFLEFGTSKMSAHPFLGPTAAQDRGKIVSAMAAKLRGRFVR